MTSRDAILEANNEAHCTHDVDFARACSEVTRVSDRYTNQLSVLVLV